MEDRILRAMTDDGALRVMTVRTTDTVAGVLAAQQAPKSLDQPLAELVTAAILYRETMAPTQRVQCFVKGRGGTGTLIADSHPEGWARVLAQLPKGPDAFDMGAGSLLQMNRSLPNGDLHQGVVSIPGGDLSEGVMQYMQLSEQIVTMVRMAAVFEDGEVKAAGGYLVQLLPEAPDRVGPVRLMAQRLEDDFSDIESRLVRTDADPAELMAELLYGMEHTPLGDSGVRAGCDCSRARVMGSLATLGKDDLESLIRDGTPLDMNCDWCNTTYRVALAELRGLLHPS
ncbi:MAG: Hsp33 family molecular chaperone HslO [Myxococcota bacterium]